MEYLQVLADHVSSSYCKWQMDETKKWFYESLRKYEDGDEMVKFVEDKDWLELNEVISLVALWLEPPRRLIEVSQCLGAGKKCFLANMPKSLSKGKFPPLLSNA